MRNRRISYYFFYIQLINANIEAYVKPIKLLQISQTANHNINCETFPIITKHSISSQF
jgi:hypothetical protein